MKFNPLPFLLSLFLCSNVWAGVNLNGDADYLTSGTNVLSGATNFSISMWVEVDTDNFDTTIDILADECTCNPSANGFWFGLDDRGGASSPLNGMTVNFRVSGASIGTKSNNDIFNTTATWHQVGFTYDGTTRQLYLDGVAITSNNINVGSGNYLPKNAALSIGACNNGTILTTGKINEFAIWASALSAQDMANLGSKVKRMPLQISPSTLRVYLPLDDHSNGSALGSLTFNDFSDNARHATDTDADGDSTAIADEVLSYP